MGSVGDVQLVFGAHATRLERIELGEQLFGIEHDAVPHHAHGALQDTRWYLMQDERLTLTRVDRVSGVGAALIADDQVRALCEHVDDFALPLVAPLSTDDHDALRLGTEHARSWTKKRPPLGGPKTRGHAPGSSERS